MQQVTRQALTLVAVAFLAAVPSAAQDRPVAVTVLGGAVLPVGDARDAMGTGWNVGVAGTFAVTPAVGLRADYLYDRFGAVEETLDVGLGPMLPAFRQVPVRSKAQMHMASLDLVWTGRRASGARLYVMGGPTLFRRRVQLTAADDRGISSQCEPQWLQCSAETIGFDRWLGIKKSNDLGFNVGAGAAFRVGLTALLVVEARYYVVRGPSFKATDGRAHDASARFLPVSVGLRF